MDYLKKINKSKILKVFLVFFALLTFIFPNVSYGQEGGSIRERAERAAENVSNLNLARRLEYDRIFITEFTGINSQRKLSKFEHEMEEGHRVRLFEYRFFLDEAGKLLTAAKADGNEDNIKYFEDQIKRAEAEAERYAQVIFDTGAGVLEGDEFTQRRILLEQSKEPLVIGTAEVNCWSWSGGIDVMCYAANAAYHGVLVPASMVMTWSSRFFDFVIENTIVNMKSWLWPEGGTSAIDIGWTVIRDFVNIAFIFVLLYISIMTIIKGSGETGRKIFGVIAIAILINFSLFLTKVVIDVGNLMALSVYETATNMENSVCKKEEDKGSLSCPFMAKAGVGSIFGGGTENTEMENYVKANINNEYIIRQSLSGALMLIILAFVLFMAAFIFLARFIILIFVLITSAAAVAGYILPQMKKIVTTKWWSALIGQTIFPIIFFILLYVSLVLLDNIDIGGPANHSGAGWVGSAHALFTYALVIMFIIGSLKISLSIASTSGGKAGSAASKMAGVAAFGLVASTGGYAARRVIGGSSRALSNRIEGNNAFSSALKSGLNKTASKSFDIRNSKSFNKATSAAKVNLGKGGGQGGYNKKIDTAIKNKEDKQKGLSAPTTQEKKVNVRLVSELDAKRNEITNVTNKKQDVTSKRDEVLKKINTITESGGNIKDRKNESMKLRKQAARYQAELKTIDTEFAQSKNEEQELIKVIEENAKKAKAREQNYVNRKQKQFFKTPGTTEFVRKQKTQAAQEAIKKQGQKDLENIAKMVTEINTPEDNKNNAEAEDKSKK